jgi:hypothetical protein
MPQYEPSQIRNAFEILRRVGQLDSAQEALERKQFTVEVSQEHSEVLRDLIVAALQELAKRDPEGLKELATRKSGGITPSFVGDPNCPC